jgi:hypothetical protein
LRILYGIESLPRQISLDDTRLPAAELESKPLRLNTDPLPPRFIPPDGGTSHEFRLAIVAQWLYAACSDYAALQRRFIDAYLAFLTAHIDSRRSELEDILQPFDGLYKVEDWIWSALRPLPRAWVPTASGLVRADMVFLDGLCPIAITFDTGIVAKLAGADVVLFRANGSALAQNPNGLFESELFGSIRHFWRGETLPKSPFRRLIETPP